MRKRKVIIGGDGEGVEFLIAELNFAQVEELMTPPAQATGDPDIKYWIGRVWRTVTWSLNNAQNFPTKDDPLNETNPHTVDDYKVRIGHQTVYELHDAVLELSKLVKQQPGEAKATVEQSTTTSAVA